MNAAFSKLSKHWSFRVLGLLSLLLAAGLAFGWVPFIQPRQPRLLAAPGPEAEIATFIRDQHPELGLQVVVGSADYVAALSSGEIDVASTDNQVGLAARLSTNAGTGTELVPLASTITTPIALYARRGTSAQLRDGAHVVLPNERQSQSRALLLLFTSGFVTFNRDPGTDLRLDDVTGNPKHLTFSVAPAVTRVALAQTSGDARLITLEYAEAAPLGLQPARDAVLGLVSAVKTVVVDTTTDIAEKGLNIPDDVKTVQDLLEIPNLKPEWQNRRKAMLDRQIDLAAWMTDQVSEALKITNS